MNENGGKVKLNDDLLDKVAGGTDLNGAVCPCCNNTDIRKMRRVSGYEKRVECCFCGAEFDI